MNDKVIEIVRNQLEQLCDVDNNLKVIDVLPEGHYAKEHIKGAISIPLDKLREQAAQKLQGDDTIIVYCTNFECPASTKAAKILLSLGYKNVLDYKGGLDDYKDGGLPLEGMYH